jgi:hypothetical protein
MEKLKLFFEQLRGKGNPTARDIRNAAAATGNITEILPDILGYATGMGIDADAELFDLTGAQDTARQEAAFQETAASLAKMSGALVTTAPDQRRDLIQSIRGTVVSLEPSANNGFRFVRMDSLQVRPPSWLVKGLIETDCFCCLYGDPATGKSFIAIELSLCVATGTPFYDLPVKKGPVIFMAGEGQSGLARRFEAWSIARHVSISGAPFYINQGTVSLIDGDSMIPVIQALERLILEIGQPPALVILDTWSRVLGGDDSAPSDAAAGVAALDDLRTRFGNFAAIVVHHEGHTKGRGRGWSGLRAAVDVELRAERGADGVVRLECTKAKDIEPMAPMAFHFAPVDLQINDGEGNAVTSAVLTPAVWTPAPEAGAKKPPIGKNQALAMDVLKRLETEAGKEPVLLGRWRDECRAEGITKQRFYDVRTSLEKSGRVKIQDTFVLSVTVSPVRNGTPYTPLLYSGGVTDVTAISDKVTESTETLPNVTVTEKGLGVENSAPFNGQPDIPDGIAPEEYRECYDTAYSTFINKGLPPDEAGREAREEIRKFIAGYNPPGSGAAVFQPVSTETEPPPLTIPDEEIDF